MRTVAAFWATVSVVGLVVGVAEIIDLIDALGSGGPTGDLNLGFSLGGGAGGFLAWRSLLRGSRRAWAAIRRAALIAAPLFLLGAVVVFFADPSTVTLSGPGGSMPMDPSMRGWVIAACVGASAFFGAQGWILSRREVREWFEADGTA